MDLTVTLNKFDGSKTVPLWCSSKHHSHLEKWVSVSCFRPKCHIATAEYVINCKKRVTCSLIIYNSN